MHRGIAEEFRGRLLRLTSRIRVGDPMDARVHLGPVVSVQQYERVRAFLADGVDEGARVLTGGGFPVGAPARGYFVEPTIFADLDPGMRVAREEIFGPVLAVLEFGDEAEAVALANAVDYGLSASVWSRNPSRVARMAAALEVGNVWCNTARRVPPRAAVRRLQGLRHRQRVRGRRDRGQHPAEGGLRAARRHGAEPGLGRPVTGVLDGLRVLDFTWVVGGPLCTKYLAMLGAEVVKVESATRPEHRKRDGQFELLNAGKLSCEVDLKSPDGADLARRLAAGSDIVVENYGVGVMRRLGLDFERLAAIQPRIVMLSLSGMGQEGPDRHLLAYGSLIQSYAGWTSLLCADEDLADDRMGMVPVWADHIAALMSTLAILGAVARREETGRGAYLDVSILESVLAMMPAQIVAASAGEQPGPVGNRSGRFVPHGVFRCAGDDRWIAIAAYDDRQWEALRSLMGHPGFGPPRSGWRARRRSRRRCRPGPRRGTRGSWNGSCGPPGCRPPSAATSTTCSPTRISPPATSSAPAGTGRRWVCRGWRRRIR